jgi:predicted GTPase
LVNLFFEKYLMVNQYSTPKPLDYIDSFYDRYLKLKFNDIRVLCDSLTAKEGNEKAESLKKNFIFFDRHLSLAAKIEEALTIDSNAKVLLYGQPNSGKTTLARLFTNDEIIFEVDETVEVNVSSLFKAFRLCWVGMARWHFIKSP